MNLTLWESLDLWDTLPMSHPNFEIVIFSNFILFFLNFKLKHYCPTDCDNTCTTGNDKQILAKSQNVNYKFYAHKYHKQIAASAITVLESFEMLYLCVLPKR